MAKIKSANLAPYAPPRLRGVVLTHDTIYGQIIHKWPEKRGKPTHPNVIWTSEQFSMASRWAANAIWQERATAEFLAKGSNYLPRDILVQLAFGKFYEVHTPDGIVMTQASHAPPDLQPAPVPPMSTWQSNSGTPSTLGTPSSSAFTFKGTAFVPLVPIDITQVMMTLGIIGGATYKAIGVTLNGSNVIQTLTSGPARSFPASFNGVVAFDLAVSFAAGVRCGVMIGRTDLSDTYGMLVYTGQAGGFMFPTTDLGGCRLAKKTPATGQTCDVSGGDFGQALAVNF